MEEKKLSLQDLDVYLSWLFDFKKFRAIDTINGIQVEKNDALIQKIAYAVDSSLEVMFHAAQAQSDVLIVHHGLFWGVVKPVTDAMYHKIRMLLDNNIALYAIHLPLDAHLEFGNNAQIAHNIGLAHIEPFCAYKGVHIGVLGSYDEPMHIDDVYAKLFQEENYTKGIKKIGKVAQPFAPIEKYTGTKKQIKKVAIISGGGTKDIAMAYAEGADLYITGDASHTAWLEAKELDMNVCFAGHYFTEIWGVRALARHLDSRFRIDSVFIESPTGL